MIDRRLPVGPRQRPALRVGDRNQRHFGIFLKECLLVRRIEPAVQRGNVRRRMAAQHREMQVVAVEVDHVEPRDVVKDHFHRADLVRQRLAQCGRATAPAGSAGTSRAAVCESPLANSVTS